MEILKKVDAIMNALNSPTSHQYANTLAHFIPHVIRLDQMLDQAIANQDQEALLGKYPKRKSLLQHESRSVENYLRLGRQSLPPGAE